jgi:four helix bundle protein
MLREVRLEVTIVSRNPFPEVHHQNLLGFDTACALQCMQDYRKVRAYPESLTLLIAVYRFTGRLPSDQRFVLCSQIQKAALSVPLNIAEGAGRSTRPDFARFIDQALGSTNEVECGLQIAVALGRVNSKAIQPIQAQVEVVRKMLC